MLARAIPTLAQLSVIFLIAIATVAGMPHPVGAEQQYQLTLRILPTRNTEVETRLLASLSKYAEVTNVEIAPNRTVDDVIRQRCGFISQPLRALFLKNNPGLDFKAQPQARTIRFPPCPYWKFETAVDVSRVVELNRVLRLRMGFSGGETIRQVAYRNPDVVDTSGRLLKTSGELVLPYESRTFTMILRQGAGTPAFVARRLAREFPELIKAHFVDNYVSQGGASIFVIDSSFSPKATKARECGGSIKDWPFNYDRMADALEANAKLAPRDRRAATILIADTGIRESDASRFPLRRDPGEGGLHARENIDDNGNDYIDDIFGANMNKDPGFPVAIEEFRDADHGTQVASVIVAGFENLRLRPLLEKRLELSLANLVSADTVGTADDGAPRYYVHIPTSSVNGAFGYAEWMRPAVLNVSFKSDTSYPAILPFLKQALYLTVIAVGNDGEQIDLYKKERYPADYRRNAKERLITVAAHDGNGKLARFSNFGTKVVDLAAPGCALDVKTFDWKPVSSSGTSLAAPLVSLTAALLYAEGLTDPRQLRNRILVTTDFDPNLKDVVYTSGRLNIEKALRIYQDIIVPRRADGTADSPKFGNITTSNEPLDICGDQLTLRDIFKIMPNYEQGKKPMLILRKIRDQGGEYRMCEAAQQVTIDFLEEGSRSAQRYKLLDLHEVIPAHW